MIPYPQWQVISPLHVSPGQAPDTVEQEKAIPTVLGLISWLRICEHNTFNLHTFMFWKNLCHSSSSRKWTLCCEHKWKKIWGLWRVTWSIPETQYALTAAEEPQEWHSAGSGCRRAEGRKQRPVIGSTHPHWWQEGCCHFPWTRGRHLAFYVLSKKTAWEGEGTPQLMSDCGAEIKAHSCRRGSRHIKGWAQQGTLQEPWNLSRIGGVWNICKV